MFNIAPVLNVPLKKRACGAFTVRCTSAYQSESTSEWPGQPSSPLPIHCLSLLEDLAGHALQTARLSCLPHHPEYHESISSTTNAVYLKVSFAATVFLLILVFHSLVCLNIESTITPGLKPLRTELASNH